MHVSHSSFRVPVIFSGLVILSVMSVQSPQSAAVEVWVELSSQQLRSEFRPRVHGGCWIQNGLGREMTQKARVTATKPEDLSLLPGSHQLPKVVLQLPYVHTCRLKK